LRIEEYNSLKGTLDSQQKSIINEAKIQAKALLEEANRKIENTIKSIKETRRTRKHQGSERI
jgi:DNA mismatch repair protein MutS2